MGLFDRPSGFGKRARQTNRRTAPSSFVAEFTKGMPSAFQMPDEFLTLAEWSDRQGFEGNGCSYIANPEQDDHCFVYLYGSAREPWPEGYLSDPDRLWPLAASGSEGSEICLWIDDHGDQQVVHHGSGSGSVLWAVLPSALSVLKLLAVGYEEPCDNDEWGDVPAGDSSALDPYRTWLRETWGQDTPRTGLEALGISGAAAGQWLTDGPADDPFKAWLENG